MKRVLFVGDADFIAAMAKVVCKMPSADLTLTCFTTSTRMAMELISNKLADVVLADYLTRWLDSGQFDTFKSDIQRINPEVEVHPISLADDQAVHKFLEQTRDDPNNAQGDP